MNGDTSRQREAGRSGFIGASVSSLSNQSSSSDVSWESIRPHDVFVCRFGDDRRRWRLTWRIQPAGDRRLGTRKDGASF